MARKISVFRRGSRWGYMVRNDNKIVAAGTADSKAAAEKAAKGSAGSRGRKKAKKRTKKKATKKRSRKKATRKAAKKSSRKASGKSARKRSVAWKTVKKPDARGYDREYRWRPSHGRDVVVQYKRQGKWRNTPNENVREYFRQVREGRRPQWPYTRALRHGTKRKHSENTSSGRGSLRSALRRDA